MSSSGPQTREGWVYFLERPSDGAIKIGWTTIYPPSRCEQVERKLGEPVSFLAAFWAQRLVESELHAQYAKRRLDGEWFKPNKRLRGAIEVARALWSQE